MVQAKLTASDGTYDDQFGCSVCINGDYAIVGAPWDGLGITSWDGITHPTDDLGFGSAYVFLKPAAGWTSTNQAIPYTHTATNGAAPDTFFGWSAAVSENGDVTVGMPGGGGLAGLGLAGSAYTYDTACTGETKLLYTGAAQDSFGQSVALSNAYVVVGAPGADRTGINSNSGAAYIFCPAVTGVLTLGNPDGGESLVAGSTYEITWETHVGSISNVLMEYSINAGLNWKVIDTVPNTGSYLWQVPQENSWECMVRISNANYPSGNDSSEKVFRIYVCPLACDMNHDCAMDLLDLSLFLDPWLTQLGNPNYNPDADFNNDNIVSLPDFCALAAEWKMKPDPHLVSYWNFNEGSGSIAGDSADDNDGAIQGATWTTGKDGWALYFHGGGQGAANSDVVRVPHSANLDITGPFRIEAWIKATGADTYLMIVDKYYGSATISKGFSFYIAGGKLRFTICSGANGCKDVYGTSELRDNAWHHVAALWDGFYQKVYVDGVLEREEPWTYPPASTANDLGIGKRIYGWGGYLPFLGAIDEVRIYAWPLTKRDSFEGDSVDAGYWTLANADKVYTSTDKAPVPDRSKSLKLWCEAGFMGQISRDFGNNYAGTIKIWYWVPKGQDRIQILSINGDFYNNYAAYWSNVSSTHWVYREGGAANYISSVPLPETARWVQYKMTADGTSTKIWIDNQDGNGFQLINEWEDIDYITFFKLGHTWCDQSAQYWDLYENDFEL